MAKYYKDISDTVNKTKFAVRLPDSFEFKTPGYYRKYPQLEPIFAGSTGVSLSMVSIANIVQLVQGNIEFTIVELEDIIIITDLLTQYTNELDKATTHLVETSSERQNVGRCKKTLRALDSINNNAKFKQDKIESKFTKSMSVMDALEQTNRIWNSL